ncbi:MAG: antitoxin [Thermoplasmata archaeon]|nr:antitoxin [Candidatus Sysuiplasma acidicola]
MISDQSYEKLVRIKGTKSFSELLSELADNARQTYKSAILKFAGTIDKEEARELHKAVSRVRSNFKARL